MPVPIHDDDDDLDTTPSGIARRLTRVAEIIARANERLDKIRAGFADPPDPEKPAIITAATSTIRPVAGHPRDLLGQRAARPHPLSGLSTSWRALHGSHAGGRAAPSALRRLLPGGPLRLI
ncbi:MAG: hypothetical protein R3F14_21050 [Polyangiaceae bacterium]